MKLHPDQHDPAAPMHLGDTTIDEQEVISAIAIASQAEFPSALECVTVDFILMAFFSNSES